MRAFYQTFPKRNALRTELDTLPRINSIKDSKTRLWYMQEAISQNWSTRALDRQISVFYYERLLSSKEPAPVAEEANK